MRVGILASAVLDLLWYLFWPSAHVAPLAFVEGTARVEFWGRQFRFFVRRATDDLYSCLPGRERDAEATILGLLNRGDTFVDVGANIGYYSVLASEAVGPAGKVIAIEPVPATAGVLRHNLRLNGATNVSAIQKACWSDRGVLSLSMSPGAYGMASAVVRRGAQTVAIECVPLDDICAPLPQVRLIKIDAEGSERQVLVGARTTLTKTDYLVVELSDQQQVVRELLKDPPFVVRDLAFRPYILASKER